MTTSPGAALRELRERRPLVHQITNYVVMNETANATLALGALPVMAHAPQEVEEMAAHGRRARAQHRHALRAVGRRDDRRRAAPRTTPASRSCSTPSARARPATAPRRRACCSTPSTSRSLRGNAGRGRGARRPPGADPRRGVDRHRPTSRPTSRATAARALGCVVVDDGARSTTSPTATQRARGRERPRAARHRHRHGLHVDARSPGCFLAVRARGAARGRGRGARRVRRRGRGRGRGSEGPGQLPRRALRRARTGSIPATLDGRRADRRPA